MNAEKDLITGEAENRRKEIGAIFEEMGITSVELALSLRTHITSCSGGKACLEKLISEMKE